VEAFPIYPSLEELQDMLPRGNKAFRRRRLFYRHASHARELGAKARDHHCSLSWLITYQAHFCVEVRFSGIWKSLLRPTIDESLPPLMTIPD
jgi:hypothetical protein